MGRQWNRDLCSQRGTRLRCAADHDAAGRGFLVDVHLLVVDEDRAAANNRVGIGADPERHGSLTLSLARGHDFDPGLLTRGGPGTFTRDTDGHTSRAARRSEGCRRSTKTGLTAGRWRRRGRDLGSRRAATGRGQRHHRRREKQMQSYGKTELHERQHMHSSCHEGQRSARDSGRLLESI